MINGHGRWANGFQAAFSTASFTMPCRRYRHDPPSHRRTARDRGKPRRSPGAHSPSATAPSSRAQGAPQGPGQIRGAQQARPAPTRRRVPGLAASLDAHHRVLDRRAGSLSATPRSKRRAEIGDCRQGWSKSGLGPRTHDHKCAPLCQWLLHRRPVNRLRQGPAPVLGSSGDR